MLGALVYTINFMFYICLHFLLKTNDLNAIKKMMHYETKRKLYKSLLVVCDVCVKTYI